MSETEIKQTIPASVGEKLKALRESRDIGALEIASKLHLDIRVINAIEDDDYKSLPYPIYIRGYIRSYGKLVGGNADELVSMFEESVGVQDPEIIPEIKYPSQSSSSDKPVKAFTYLIILGLVVLVIAWWQSNYIIELQPDSGNSVPASDVVTSIDPEPQSQTVTAPYYSPQTPLQTPLQIPVQLLDIDQFSTETLDAGISDITTSEVAAETIVQTDSESEIVDSQLIQSETPVDEDSTSSVLATDQVTPPATPATDGPDVLVVSLTADSWIEITDVNNQKLFMDLARTGSTLNLRGTAPFEILLGFAQGVTLEYNGTPFDIAPYSRAGVAKFTLEQ